MLGGAGGVVSLAADAPIIAERVFQSAAPNAVAISSRLSLTVISVFAGSEACQDHGTGEDVTLSIIVPSPRSAVLSWSLA